MAEPKEQEINYPLFSPGQPVTYIRFSSSMEPTVLIGITEGDGGGGPICVRLDGEPCVVVVSTEGKNIRLDGDRVLYHGHNVKLEYFGVGYDPNDMESLPDVSIHVSGESMPDELI